MACRAIILSVPHSGTRSVEKFLGGGTRRYVQFPIDIEKAQRMADHPDAVLVIRDPALPILSAVERNDDRPWRVMWALEVLYSLRWPEKIFRIGIDDLPHLGKRDYLLKRLYHAGERGRLEDELGRRMPKMWSLFGELGRNERLFRPRLEDLGYKDLQWWT